MAYKLAMRVQKLRTALHKRVQLRAIILAGQAARILLAHFVQSLYCTTQCNGCVHTLDALEPATTGTALRVPQMGNMFLPDVLAMNAKDANSHRKLCSPQAETQQLHCLTSLL